LAGEDKKRKGKRRDAIQLLAFIAHTREILDKPVISVL